MLNLKPNTSDELLFLTTRISGQTAKGRQVGGTGFYFGFGTPDAGGRSPAMIVTNKHVMKDIASGGAIHVHLRETGNPGMPSLNSVGIKPNEFGRFWIQHPDQNVDLCAAPISAICEAAGIQEHSLFFTCLVRDTTLLRTKS